MARMRTSCNDDDEEEEEDEKKEGKKEGEGCRHRAESVVAGSVRERTGAVR